MNGASFDGDRIRILVERIQAGIDYEYSCGELYPLYRRKVHRFFLGRGFSADEGAELTQQTFIRVFSHMGDLHDPSRLGSWIFEIATNIYRNELRRRGAAKRDAGERSIEDLVESQAGRADAIPALSSKAPSPLDRALRHESSKSLRAAVRQLPPQMRRCLFLRLYHDLKYREIAELMKISIETVKAHLHQAQKRLKLVLSERPDDEKTEGAL